MLWGVIFYVVRLSGSLPELLAERQANVVI